MVISSLSALFGQVFTWPGLDACHSSSIQGAPRAGRPIRPFSRSKHRPHTAGPQSKEAARRRRHIAKGMLQVSDPWERKDLGRVVNPHRSGGGYTRDGYRLAG